MRNRTLRTFLAWSVTAFVFLLFAFPNYCEKCSYRDVSRAFAKKSQALHPTCCGGGAAPDASGESGDRSDKPSGGSHVRYSFCVAKSLSSIAERRDVEAEIRLAIAPSPFRLDEPEFHRLSPVFDHKDGRAPPA